MASVVQVFLALLLVSCVHGQAPAYVSQLAGQCADATIGSRMSNCTLAYQRIVGPSNSSSSTRYDAVCNNIQALATFFGCMRNAFASCYANSNFAGLLQTESRARDAYQYYCDHRSEFNEDCVATATQTDSCTVNADRAHSAARGQSDIVQATCNYLKTLRGCLYNIGGSCPNHNRDAYNTFYVKYYPPACAGDALSPPTSFLLLGACAVLLSKMAAAFLF